jgi:hypothetical protein
MFVEKKDRLKLLAFSHWLNPRAEVRFSGADPLAWAPIECYLSAKGGLKAPFGT